MLAIVDGPNPSFLTLCSQWKAPNGQKCLSVAINLPSGIEAPDISPGIAATGGEIELIVK